MTPMFPRFRADTERVLRAAHEIMNKKEESLDPYVYGPSRVISDLLQIIREREERIDLLLIKAAEKRRDRWHATYNAVLQPVPFIKGIDNTSDRTVVTQALHLLARDQANAAHGAIAATVALEPAPETK